MASTEPKISKQAVAGKTRIITLTIPETLEIIRKPGIVTNHSIIMAAYKIGLLNNYGIKKHREIITCNNLRQYRYCLINGTLNTLVSLHLCGCQIK